MLWGRQRASVKENVRNNLNEKLSYSPEETSNILRVNFGMMTAEDIDAIKWTLPKRKCASRKNEKHRALIKSSLYAKRE